LTRDLPQGKCDLRDREWLRRPDFCLACLEKGTPNVKRRNRMPNDNNDVRVLSRLGARELTPEESEQIGGSNAFIPTLLSVIVTHTATGNDTRLDS
jgi:hypothetical protein